MSSLKKKILYSTHHRLQVRKICSRSTMKFLRSRCLTVGYNFKSAFLKGR